MSQKVGFIGLGVLGSAMAPNVIKGGFEVIGFDLRDDAVSKMVEAGMEAGTSPHDVAEKSEVIITCLPSIDALHAVANDLIQTNGAGKVVIETSTFPVREKEAFRDTLILAGYDVLDCPVSGNRMLAVKGQLTAFGSGDKQIYERVEPIISAFAHRAFHVGDFGCGTTFKLCGNILNLVHNAVAAEVMVLAMKSGLDLQQFHDVISGSGSSSSMFETRGALMVKNDYEHEGSNFSIPIKDARFISEHAASLAVPTPIYQAALQTYYAAVAQGHMHEDAAAVCAAVERAANCERGKG